MVCLVEFPPPPKKARVSVFNLDSLSWPHTVSPSSGNTFGFGQVWLSNKNWQAMVYLGDGGGHRTQAPPIGVDPRSA